MRKDTLKISNKKILPLLICLSLLCGVLGPWLSTPLQAKYPPTIKWKEISDDRFIVVFPKGYENEAFYTLETANELHEKLTRLWGQGVRERTRILLTDVYDDHNGSAIFFPYNNIEIYLHNPPPDSDLGSGRDWIRNVLSHEMTHIITSNFGSGFTYFLRGLFGNNPAFYPIVYMPSWMIEGLAVYAESHLNEGGRLNTPDYPQMLKQIAAAGKLPHWTDVWGDTTAWPGPKSRYMYGAAFFDFLGRKYGKDKIREFIKTFGRYPIPFTVTKKSGPLLLTTHQRFKMVFGKGVSLLWSEFYADQVPPTGSSALPASFEVLTRGGYYHSHPQVADEHTIFYAHRDYEQYAGIYRLDTRSGKSERLVSRYGVNGLFYSSKEHALYFSALEYYKTYYYYADLYRYDLKRRSLKRLSKGARLAYPVPAPARPGHIYCIQRKGTKSYLAVLDTASGNVKTLSPGFDSAAFPAISPDNRSIAVSIKRKNTEWAVGLFDTEGKSFSILTDEKTKCYQPVWQSSAKLFLICRQDKTYRLASVDINTRDFFIYRSSHMPAVRTFCLDPKGKNAAVSFFDANGFNLGRIPLNSLESAPLPMNPSAVEREKEHNVQDKARDKAQDDTKNKKIKSYRFFRELWPKYINGNFRNAGNEIQPGIYIDGHDLPDRHIYSIEAFYGLYSKTFNYAFSYTYNGLFPTLTLRYSDLSDDQHSSEYGDYIHNEKKWQLSALFPLLTRQRYQFFIYSDVHFEKVTQDYTDLGASLNLELNGVKAGLFFNSAKRYYDSISLSDGFQFGVSYAREFEFMGSDYEINTAAIEYKQYLTLFRPNVLAVRFAATESWGEAKRIFSMGGHETYTAYSLAGSDILELNRAYPSGYFAGSAGYLFNVEYRLSLWKIEKALLINSSLERIYLSLFADIGQVWLKEPWKKLDPTISYGAELNLLLYVGDFKFNLSGGVALGHNPTRSATLYFRLGNSF